MNNTKGFALVSLLAVVLGVLVLGGAGYWAMKPQAAQAPEDGSSKIAWHFTSEAEADGIPYTSIAVSIDGTLYEAGRFTGSCSEVAANGGIDGKGLLIGELSAAQCWFAGGGNEIGVFAHEDGGYDLMVGELSEGAEGAGLFRGDFSIIQTIE
jgi:hypothetical protein